MMCIIAGDATFVLRRGLGERRVISTPEPPHSATLRHQHGPGTAQPTLDLDEPMTG